MSSQEDSQQSQDSVMTLIEENRHEILYFAYGSNLSTAQMRERCPYSTPIGLGYLAGWRWIINGRGYANIVPLLDNEEGSTTEDRGVYGLLYLLPPRDEERLDGYEGVPFAYQKMQADMRWAKDDQGREVNEAVRALIYVDGERVEEDAPLDEYIGRMERGIEDMVQNWGLDEEYANRVMRRFWTKPKP